MARENADLIIKNGYFLSMNMKSGACAYHNIQQFSQLQLTTCISGLLVTLVVTMHSGRVPTNNSSLDLGELDHVPSWWPNDGDGVTRH